MKNGQEPKNYNDASRPITPLASNSDIMIPTIPMSDGESCEADNTEVRNKKTFKFQQPLKESASASIYSNIRK